MQLKSLRLASALLAFGGLITAPAHAQNAKVPGGLVHEAEFQRLWEQNGDRWAEEDKEIQSKLAELEAKFGKKPNIIHILWDDMRYGAVGHRLLTDISGYEAPNLEQMAQDGMSFTRMYTEPSCTPTRVAAATGRLAVRSGMVFPIFPIHRMGLPATEVTIAVCPFKAAKAVPLSASHNRTVLSPPPETICFPFGLKPTESTEPV